MQGRGKWAEIWREKNVIWWDNALFASKTFFKIIIVWKKFDCRVPQEWKKKLNTLVLVFEIIMQWINVCLGGCAKINVFEKIFYIPAGHLLLEKNFKKPLHCSLFKANSVPPNYIFFHILVARAAKYLAFPFVQYHVLFQARAKKKVCFLI